MFFNCISYRICSIVENYELTIIAPVGMFLGYFPIMLIEKNIMKLYENKLLKAILGFHIIMALFMISVYFIFIVLTNLNIINL